MGRIKDLHAKEADGSISEDEQKELDELKKEADEVVEESSDSDDSTDEANATDSDDDAADADSEEEKKEIEQAGIRLADVALKAFRKGISKDAKKAAAAGDSKSDKGETKPQGKELIKQFFTALFEKDYTKLDHLSGGTDADGGFLVPQEYSDDFVEARQNATVMRRAGATVIQIEGNTFNLPQLATRPRAYWTNELAAKSSTSASWTNITLTPYTLAAIMTASNQVIADAKIGGNLIEVITRLLTEAIAFEEDNAFFTGSGSGQPTGLDSYTVNTVAAGGALTADHLIDAVYQLTQGYRSRAKWFMNSRTLRVVRQLKDTQNRYIFDAALSGVEFPTILGRPVFEQDDLAADEIWFGDPAGYWIADRIGISVKVSDVAVVGGESGFERNFTAIRVEERTDGELADTAAFVQITSTGVA